MQVKTVLVLTIEEMREAVASHYESIIKQNPKIVSELIIYGYSEILGKKDKLPCLRNQISETIELFRRFNLGDKFIKEHEAEGIICLNKFEEVIIPLSSKGQT